ncbi:quinone oxidoreductase family protein [Pseudomonas frederiksbergensis]|uniref:quinone oxidoreductase family protein n=1 Tax=Pseudomonas frederiksbergensis TaxID=104087 RepID=UPI000F4683DF|nr:quinone oxidoreductase [Pseudomonas frederiksbergensis]RON48339.1 quinone oxidoreductase [Pseudomonas frederiksbergensis]
MTRAYGIVFAAPGEPEVLELREYELRAPGPGEITVAIEAAGVNFTDLHRRSGALEDGSLFPRGIGMEGAGRVVECGRQVHGFAPGDRVAFVDSSTGSYASHAVLPAVRAIRLPDDVPSDLAASLMFKGLTAEYLTHRCVPLKPDDWVVWHAAAGGVGSIATGWLVARGVRVIGLASTEAKRRQVLNAGCIAALDPEAPAALAYILDLTEGKGAHIVFDSVGSATVEMSLASLRQRGHLVLFGNASGDVTGFNLSRLGQLGSLHVTRPSLKHYIGQNSDLAAASAHVLLALADGVIRPPQVTRLPLCEAAQAHHIVEARQTQGSLILVP